MNITFLLTQSLDSPGGVGRFFPIAKELVKRNNKVTIIALHHNFASLHNSEKSFTINGVHVNYVAQMHVKKEGNKKTYFPPVKLFFVILWATWQLTKHALSIESDVIHVCKAQPMNGIAAWIIHIFRKTPIYLEADDYEAENNKFSSPLQARIVQYFEDFLPSFSRGITINTTFIKDHFHNLGYKNIPMILVPNGVDRERFTYKDWWPIQQEKILSKYGLSSSTPLVVYVGSMSLTGHATDLLLYAFVQVIAEIEDAHLLLVGSGEDFDYLQTLTQQLGIANSVTFVGQVSSKQVPMYYDLGWITADPLRDSSKTQASLSLKLFESICSGTPCVTADIGDRRQMIGNSSLAIQPDSRNSLSDALVDLLQNREKRERMTQSANIEKENHFWDKRIKDFVRIYEINS